MKEHSSKGMPRWPSNRVKEPVDFPSARVWMILATVRRRHSPDAGPGAWRPTRSRGRV
jgi:hypothetical protein